MRKPRRNNAESVRVRVTAKERQAINRNAKRSRVTISEYIRVCALAGLRVETKTTLKRSARS